jgi:hypothetical protein
MSNKYLKEMPNLSIQNLQELEISKHKIQSQFFEYLKMRKFFERSFYIRLGENRFVPFQIISDYIYSLLLIDLFSVCDLAINYVLMKNGYEKSRNSKKKIIFLEENNLIQQAAYIKWYKEWRNDVAHHLKKISYSELSQATEDIRKQLIAWEIFFDKQFDLFFENELPENYKMGVRIDKIRILEYSILFINQPVGLSPAWSETINLNIDSYLSNLEGQ